MVGNKLEKNIISDLATTLSGESGIAIRSSGQATQRPILRGYSGDRFLITSDGFELGDMSNTTADHAVSMEISAADGVEVMRGPETLAYGSNTIAGIINIITPFKNPKKLSSTNYKLLFGHESSNQSNSIGSDVNIPLNDYQLSMSLNNRSANDQSSPIGTLKNTALEKNDLTLNLTKFGEKDLITIELKDFSMDYGIPGSPEGHINGVDLALKNQTQKLKYHSDINLLSFNILDLEQGYVRYGHKEFVKGSDYASVDLRQDIIYFNAMLTSKNLKIGANFQNRDYFTKGFIWTPNTNEMKFSLFGVHTKNLTNKKFQLSGRVEYRSINPSADDTFFSNIDANDVRKRDYLLASFGASAQKNWDNISIYNHLLFTSRAPRIEDLYSDGPHLGTYSYEIGEPNLEQENTIGFENTTSFSGNKYELKLTSYINYSTNFHILQKEGDGYEPGATWIEWGSGSAGWLYKYKLYGKETLIQGFEPSVKLNLKYFSLLANASICRGINLEDDKPLAYIPPDLLRIQIEKRISFLNNTIEGIFVSDQNKLGEFEYPTDGYKLLNYNCSYTFSKSENIHQIIFQVTNILDETYYNHLSKIKMIMPEPGRGINLRYKVNF
jgi:iron complex outermembrane receptor protein